MIKTKTKMMTEQDILDYGYVMDGCHAYSKPPFRCYLYRGGIADLESNDMFEMTITGISNIRELGIAEKRFYGECAKLYEEKAKIYKTLEQNYIVPEK